VKSWVSCGCEAVEEGEVRNGNARDALQALWDSPRTRAFRRAKSHLL
jgi:hypothetical protein